MWDQLSKDFELRPENGINPVREILTEIDVHVSGRAGSFSVQQQKGT